MGLDFKSALAKGALEGHRARAAGQGREGPGKSGPELLDESLRGGEVDEHETARGAEHAPQLPKSGPDLRGGQDVEEVAGEDGVERIVGIRERRHVGVAEAVLRMGAVAHASAGAVEHRPGEVHALHPAGGGSDDQGAQREACPGPRVQNALPVLDRQPRLSQGPGLAGNERNEMVVEGRDPPVGAPQGSGRSQRGEEHE